MLFTRCPECETTFRVTDETLKKAHGQVRCGRCASVFNAYAELRDPNARSFDRSDLPAAGPRRAETEPSPATAALVPPASAAPAAQDFPPSVAPPEESTTPDTEEPSPITPITPLETSVAPELSPPADPVVASLGVGSVADVVAQVEEATAAADDSEPRDTDSHDAADGDGDGDDTDAPISAKEVDAVLTTPVVVRSPLARWSPFGDVPADDPHGHRSWWGAAAGIALLTLTLQVLAHFRTELAGAPSVGPWVQGAYDLFGVEVRPRWDVHQYEIVDWVATAEPNERGLGSLKITAHIMNRGPARQPFPAVALKLKDRWEDPVGRRLFPPTEYLESDASQDRMMAPGETTRAEIEVIDPGPDAYGFELDVCIEVEATLVSCGTDEVFL